MNASAFSTISSTTVSDASQRQGVEALVQTVATLRHPTGGCPWDIAQDPDTLRKYLLEEAHELLEVLHDYSQVKQAHATRVPSDVSSSLPCPMPQAWQDHYKEELGDVLLQVLLHSQMASEYGWFDFQEVCQTLNEKLIRRHPHVFPPEGLTQEVLDSPEAVSQQWQTIKAQEKASSQSEILSLEVPQGILETIQPSLETSSALQYAHQVSTTAVKAGFDWGTWQALWACVRSEVSELEAEVPETLTRETLQTQPAAQRLRQEEELGDLLFSVVSVAGRLKLCPDTALWRATDKFKRRFSQMESVLCTHEAWQHRTIDTLTLDEWDTLWQLAKQHVSQPL
ncbi:MAG: YabN family protein [Vampirovibrionales bacterium]